MDTLTSLLQTSDLLLLLPVGQTYLEVIVPRSPENVVGYPQQRSEQVKGKAE